MATIPIGRLFLAGTSRNLLHLLPTIHMQIQMCLQIHTPKPRWLPVSFSRLKRLRAGTSNQAGTVLLRAAMEETDTGLREELNKGAMALTTSSGHQGAHSKAVDMAQTDLGMRRDTALRTREETHMADLREAAILMLP